MREILLHTQGQSSSNTAVNFSEFLCVPAVPHRLALCVGPLGGLLDSCASVNISVHIFKRKRRGLTGAIGGDTGEGMSDMC